MAEFIELHYVWGGKIIEELIHNRHCNKAS